MSLLSAPASLKRLQLLASVDNDEGLAHDMLLLFEREAPRHLAVIRAAIERGDTAAIAVAAHGFRGSATNFGTDPLLDSLIELENCADLGDLPACAAVTSRIDIEAAALLDVLRVSEESPRCAS